MGVFKNGVGRPSNETIKKRNIFKVICVLLVLIIIGLICYILNDKGIIKINNNKKDSKNIVKKEEVSIDDAKKELDRFALNGDYFFMVDKKMNDDYKGYLAITKSKSQKKNYTCKEMFGNDIEPYSYDPDNHSWAVGGLCYDGEAIDFYEYETVNKEYMKLFDKNLPKKTISPYMSRHYEYSKTKNGFTLMSCECDDGADATEGKNKIYDAYKENNELHVIFSVIPFYYQDGVNVVFDSRKLSYSLEVDIKYDVETDEITNADEIFEKYKDKLPKYEFVLEKKEGSYIYKSFSKVK